MNETNNRGKNVEKGKSGFQPTITQAPKAPTSSPASGSGKSNLDSKVEVSDKTQSGMEDLYNNMFRKAVKSLGDFLPENVTWEEQIALAKDPLDPSTLDKFSHLYFDRYSYVKRVDFDSVLEILVTVASHEKASPVTLARLAVIDVYDIRLSEVVEAVAVNPNTDRETLAFLMADKVLEHGALEMTDIAYAAQNNWLSRLDLVN